MKSMVHKQDQLRQRADYTYKFNAQTGRHGWLRLTPAYSLKIVEELISKHEHAHRVFDPFCGTGTTALSAIYHGHEGVTSDINPFLIWLTQAKTAYYSPRDVAELRESYSSTLKLVKQKAIEPIPAPPIHNIERWWDQKTLEYLRFLYSAISATTGENSPARILLFIAFCRTLIKLSNAAFNHQSMSFKKKGQLTLDLDIDLISVFIDDVNFVLQGAVENPSGSATVVFGDSRNLTNILKGSFDLIVTSPPYANRMSYIRELRPYMYWLKFLVNGRDAGEMDWTAIGGTWGIATSRLMDWKRPSGRYENDHLDDVLDKIARSDNKNGAVLANYVAKYFDDMWLHIQSLTSVLAYNAEVHYIVGNSSFYGTLVSTQLLFAEMMKKVGLDSVECKPIRKRNSKKELIEFDVTGKWHNC